MRKTVLSTLVVALLLGAFSVDARPAMAETNPAAKPVVVVSFAGYDKLMADVKLAGELAGRQEIATGLEGMLTLLTQGKGLAGVDKKKPWGAAVWFDGSQPAGYAFLPVDDLDALEDLFKPYIDEVEDLGDGLFKVKGKGPGQKIIVKSVEGWLFVSNKAESLSAVPENPLKLLGGMHKQYDLAVRLNARNVPAQQRKKFGAQIRQQIKNDLRQRPGEDEQDYALRKLAGGMGQRVFLAFVRDVNRLTLGLALDNDSTTALVDLAVTAKKGSKLAQALDAMAQTKTQFGGFRLPEAFLTANVAMSCPHADSAELDKLFEMICAKACGEIDTHESAPERAGRAKEIVAGLLDVAKETIATGRADGAVSVLLKPDAATLVAARHVADGPQLEEVLGKVVEAVKAEHPDFVRKVLKTDVGEFQGVRLHTISMEVPGDAPERDKIIGLIGETLELVVGIGDEAVYVAAGKDAMSTLKKALEQSADPQQAPPAEFSFSMGQLAKLIAELGDGQEKNQAKAVLAALKDVSGKDHVKVSVTPIKQGAKLRFELEEGVLRMIGAAGKSLAD